MDRIVCIPEWRYNLMLKSFDEAMKELKELKKELKKVSAEDATSAKKERIF